MGREGEKNGRDHLVAFWLTVVAHKCHGKLTFSRHILLSYTRTSTAEHGQNLIQSHGKTWSLTAEQELTLLSRFCLIIPNPDHYAIGIGKIPISTRIVIFSSNSY